jgi:hypothetical protein
MAMVAVVEGVGAVEIVAGAGAVGRWICPPR